MPSITPEQLARLIKILGMLGSEHEGERINDGAQAEKLRKETGLTWEELLKNATNGSATPNGHDTQNDWTNVAKIRVGL